MVLAMINAIKVDVDRGVPRKCCHQPLASQYKKWQQQPFQEKGESTDHPAAAVCCHSIVAFAWKEKPPKRRARASFSRAWRARLRSLDFVVVVVVLLLGFQSS